MSRNELRILTPIGEVPPLDMDLTRSIRALPDDAPLTELAQIIDKWEKKAIIRFRAQERTNKSDTLVVDCW